MGTVVALPPRGRYLAHEAGRLAGVSGTTIGQWARRGLIRSSHDERPPRVYSFQDVAEALVVHALIEEGVPHARIRRALEGLRQRFGDWPLTHAELATVAGTREGTARVLVLEDSQSYESAGAGWQQTADSALRRVTGDLRRGGWVVRALPDVTHIEVDPERLSGRPTIRGRRLAAEKVAELGGSAEGVRLLRDDYGLSPEEIRDARRWWEATETYAAA